MILSAMSRERLKTSAEIMPDLIPVLIDGESNEELS